MVNKDDLLEAAISLTLDRGTVPSLAEVAREVGLSKQGVLHHFPSRDALDQAVLHRALSRLDAAMTEAAKEGRAAETYLRLARPSKEDRAAALTMVAMLRGGTGTSLPSAVAEAVARWQSMIADELGDPVRAQVVRLVGDGLFGESLVTGTPPSAEMLDELVAHLVADRRTRRR